MAFNTEKYLAPVVLVTISSNVFVWHAPRFIGTLSLVGSKHTHILSGFFMIVIELTQGLVLIVR